MIKSLFDEDEKNGSAEESVLSIGKTNPGDDAVKDSDAVETPKASDSDSTDNTLEPRSAPDVKPAAKAPEVRAPDILEIPGDYDLEREIALIEADLDHDATQVDGEKLNPGFRAEPSANARQDNKLSSDKTLDAEQNSYQQGKFEPGVSQEEFVPDSPGETFRKTGMAYSASIALFGSVVFMLIIGWFADLLLGIQPWGKVIGIAIGAGIGFMQFFRITSRIFKPRPNDFERVSISSREPDINPNVVADGQSEAGGAVQTSPSVQTGEDNPD